MDPSYESGSEALPIWWIRAVNRRRKPTGPLPTRLHWPKPNLNTKTGKICRCMSTSLRAMRTPLLQPSMRSGTKPSFTIWTTTWTAPNLAIAVHELRYALCQMDGNLAILASDLAAKVAEKAESPVGILLNVMVRPWRA